MVPKINKLKRLKNKALRCLRSGEFREAERLLTQFCQLHQKDPEAWFLLGAIYGKAGQIPRAIECSKKALVLNPAHIDAMNNLGNACHRASMFGEAEHCFRAVLKSRPDAADVYDMLGYVLQEQGRHDEARASYCKALEINPGLSGTAYLLAAMEGGGSFPDKAPEAYVRGLFDGFADHFEHTLVKDLGYQVPELVYKAVVDALGRARQEGYKILDIGCGTGLCGEQVKSLSGKLVGVDLSSNMIEVARKKAIYDNLHLADVVEFMRSEEETYDVVLSADVFIYIGDLVPVFEACRAVLMPGGVFLFSIETTDDCRDYCLRSTNRYAHSRAYIARLAGEFHMNVLACSEVVIRQQKGEPVKGFLYTLKMILS